MRNIFKGLIVAALAAAVFVPNAAQAAADCTPIPRGESRAWKSDRAEYRKADTWVYGDSITYQTRDHLRRVVKGREAIDAVWGRNTQSAVDALAADLRKNRKHHPDVIVMATGTNDLGNVRKFKRQAVRARNLTRRAGIRLVWVNTYVDTNIYSHGNDRKANRILRNLKGVKDVKWSASNKSSRTHGRSTLLYDGIHVNGAGCTERNRLIGKAL